MKHGGHRGPVSRWADLTGEIVAMREQRQSGVADLQQIDADSWLVGWGSRGRRLNRQLGLRPARAKGTTPAGFLLERSAHSQAGARACAGRRSLRISSMDGPRIERVLIQKTPAPGGAGRKEGTTSPLPIIDNRSLSGRRMVGVDANCWGAMDAPVPHRNRSRWASSGIRQHGCHTPRPEPVARWRNWSVFRPQRSVAGNFGGRAVRLPLVFRLRSPSAHGRGGVHSLFRPCCTHRVGMPWPGGGRRAR